MTPTFSKCRKRRRSQRRVMITGVWIVLVALYGYIELKSFQAFFFRDPDATVISIGNSHSPDNSHWDLNPHPPIPSKISDTPKSQNISEESKFCPNDMLYKQETNQRKQKARNKYLGKPFWIPAYPGSGSELVRVLIQRLSGGVGGGEIYAAGTQKRFCQGSLTCKTHWPSWAAREHPTSNPKVGIRHFHPQLILLVRHPKNAIPSLFNHLWEMKHGKAFHSIQAPETEWKIWRDANLLEQLQSWKSLFLKWSNPTYVSLYYNRSMILLYEDLISTPDPLVKLVQFLRTHHDHPKTNASLVSSPHTLLVPDSHVPCIWYQVVVQQQQQQQQQKHPKKSNLKSQSIKRANHTYQPGYTMVQRNQIFQMLEELQMAFPHDAEIVRMVRRYQTALES